MSASAFESRRLALQRRMAGAKLDALLVSHSANVRYLSGFTGSNGLVLMLVDRAILFTDPRYKIQAASEVDCRVQVVRGPLLPHALAVIKRLRARRLGFENNRVSFEAYQFLKEHLPLKTALDPVAGWVEEQRMIKSDDEIDHIRRSVDLNSAAFERAVTRLRPDMRESELAAELDYRMRRLGAEGPAFETIVASGPRTAWPHARPSSDKLRGNALVLVDMGANLDGYASDMTRMLFVGRPGARVKRTYGAVLEAQLAAIDAVRAGVTAESVDRAARRVLRSHKLDRAFVHSTGHGLGLEIHEPPRLGKKDKVTLQAGMAITVEPGVYLEGFAGIRIEDTVVVTSNGCRVLTPTSKDLRVI